MAFSNFDFDSRLRERDSQAGFTGEDLRVDSFLVLTITMRMSRGGRELGCFETYPGGLVSFVLFEFRRLRLISAQIYQFGVIGSAHLLGLTALTVLGGASGVLQAYINS